jgi:hypothetical protein
MHISRPPTTRTPLPDAHCRPVFLAFSSFFYFIRRTTGPAPPRPFLSRLNILGNDAVYELQRMEPLDMFSQHDMPKVRRARVKSQLQQP